MSFMSFKFTLLLLFALSYLLLYGYFILTVIVFGIFLIFTCKQRQDYFVGQTERRIEPPILRFTTHVSSDLFPIKAGHTDKISNDNSYWHALSKGSVLNKSVSFEDGISQSFENMWGNGSFSSTSSPKRSAKIKLNTTMPVLMSSPMSTRQRRSGNENLNKSVLSAAGPLLSSPFMPQIKRALGLEPKAQPHYSTQGTRRHSFGLGAQSTMSPASPGALPLVRLNKSRRMSLTERNTSMMNRSSTVKIAPPLPGKVSSLSLYQLRNDSMVAEERGTPDTYAVISALKERRKRSINAHEETQEHPVPQAKRRRQESQQSNASTSSMPSLPDNLPDLSSTDFSMRLETPGIKRPSRPSQDDYLEWEMERNAKRARVGDAKNNSILSSLSSSRRFATLQKGKRKEFEKSFNEKENDSCQDGYKAKTQRKEPPKLTHLDITIETQSPTQMRKPESVVSEKQTPHLTNGNSQTDTDLTKQADSKEQPLKEKSGPILRNIPTMKKTASVYSGFNTSASFKKSQYANVVATIEDYDSDREAEQKRVKQMLQDLDNSFAEKDKTSVNGSERKKVDIPTSLSTISSLAATVTTAVSIATVSSSIATTTTTTTASVLSALGNIPKSPVQETCQPTFKSVFPPADNAATTVAAVSASTTLGSVVSPPTSSVATSSQLLSSSVVTGSATTTDKPDTGKISFGTNLTSSLGGNQSVVSGSSAPPSGGFSFSAQTGAASTGVTSVGGFNYTTSTAVTTTAAASGTATTANSAGLSFGQKPDTTAVTGFRFASGPTAPPPAYTTAVTPVVSSTTVPSTATGGFSFGATSTTKATVGTTGSGFSSTSASAAAPGGGFAFGSVAPVQATSTSTGAVAGNTSGFAFNSTPAATSAASNTGGFSFGASVPSTAAASTAPSLGGFNFGASVPSTAAASTASSHGGFTFGASVPSTAAASTAPSHGGFTFGASVPSTATTSIAAPAGFSFTGSTPGTTSNPVGFAFGGLPATTTSVPNVQFGAGAGQQTANVGGFGSSNASVTSAPGFTFGGAQTVTGGAAPPAYGAQTSSTSTPFSFNAGAATSTSASATPFSFNAGVAKATSVATPFSFNAGSSATAATVSSLQTGTQATQAAGGSGTGFSFGQGTNASAVPSGTFQFGSSTAAAPAFGSSNAQPAPAFGSTNPAPAFGSANPTPAFGSTNSVPAFGSTTNQQPAFGSTNQPPAFGSTATNQTQAFGSGTPTFGASANQQQSNTPAFGATASAAPGFGKSHSMPAFGSTTDNTNGTFNFGNPAPNVNPFGQGQTTPAKQTGSAFGQISSNVTPKQQTGAMFGFGGQSNTNSSASKGFDFSAAGGSSSQNPGGFNFMAASTVPVFNFGATGATPSTFGVAGGTATPGAFSVGTGEAPRPPRAISKAKRRVRR